MVVFLILAFLALHVSGILISLLFIKKFETVEVDGYKIHFKRTGSGSKKIILIHGMFSNLHCWDRFLKYKDPDAEYFSIDLPQMGESISKKLDAPTMQIEHLIYGFCKKLDLKNPILVGCSLGGLVAYLASTQYPEFYKKCVVVASPFNKQILLLPLYKFSVLAYGLNFLVNPILVAIGHFRIAHQGFSFKQVFIILSKFRHIRHFKSSIEYTHLIARVDESLLITTKVENYHFIWGNKDHLVKKSNFDNFIGQNKKLDYEEIPDASHHPMESHPKEFAFLLKKITDHGTDID